MTHKDYKAIASVFFDYRKNFADLINVNEAVDLTVQCIAARLAVMLAKDNPRFDTKRFLTACGTGDISK